MQEGRGYAIGTVFRLDDGTVIWVPEDGTAPTTDLPPTDTSPPTEAPLDPFTQSPDQP
jgi:hypothetical protein